MRYMTIDSNLDIYVTAIKDRALSFGVFVLRALVFVKRRKSVVKRRAEIYVPLGFCSSNTKWVTRLALSAGA